jgi:DNA-binding NtrC family response regulator
LAKAVAGNRLMNEPVELGQPGAARDALIGHSRPMQAIYKEIGRIAAKPVTVLIRGETGTGKELIARAIYQHSDRANAPFVAINCAAIPETLLESELFGHERGAFTGAETRRIGRFEQAHRGTIFLDEIGDLGPGIQVKLLRVLQERCLQRLGGHETIPLDVRVIAATHHDLDEARRRQRFRDDLFYRLSVVTIALPPLRERQEDVPELVNYFLRKYGPELGTPQAAIQAEALALLRAQAWLGNVRELENVVRKLLLLARGFPISVEHVRSAVAPPPAPASPASQPLRELAGGLLAAVQRGELTDAHGCLVEAAEREVIGQAIQLAQGNQARAARWLGLSRLTLREKLQRFGLHPARENQPEE